MNTKRRIVAVGWGCLLAAIWCCPAVVAQQNNFSKRPAHRSQVAPPKRAFVIPPQYRGKLAIFILAGQSNMEGDGPLEEYQPENTQGRVFVFDKNYRWEIGKEPVRNNRVGPSIAFAKALIDADTSLAVGIINCARGGTNIGQWQRHFEDDSLYATMMKLAKAASFQGEICGVLFFQGENDTEGDAYDHPADWANYFQTFVADVRRDLDKPDLPVVYAQLGFVKNHSLWDVVKQQQSSVSVPNVGMIKTDDLPYQKGQIHYTTSAYIEIGRRFAKKYTEIKPLQPDLKK